MRPRSIRKHAAILAGAKEVFLEQGYGAASMDVISERADVSKRTIYKHFESKYELFSAVVRRMCKNVLPAEQEFEVFKNIPIEKALHTLGVQFLREIYHPDQIALFRTVIGEVRQFPELGAVFLDGPISGSETRIGAFFAHEVEHGDLTIADMNLAAARFLGLLKSDLHMRLLFSKRKRVSANEIDKQVRGAVELFLNGARPRN